MDTLGGAFKKLRRQVTDPAKNEESLKLVATIRQAAEESAKLIPAKTEDLPAAEREKFTAAYREKMKEFIGDIQKLETALKTGQNDVAAKIVEQMGKMQKASHKEFKRPDAH